MANWSAGDVTVNDVSLHYYRIGAETGDKPPLVLCHGITDNGLCWTRTAQVLQDEYDIIMMDARGHGLSDKPETGYNPKQHAADLAELIRALDLGAPRLLGHSMGAATVATLAATYPDRAGRIVLEDPPWRVEQGDPAEHMARRTEWRANLAERQRLSVDAIVAAGRRDNPKWDESEFAPWAQAKKQVSPHVLDYVGVTVTPWRAIVKKIQCPVLLITGDPALGAIVTPELAAEAQRLNDNIRVAHIAGAGHNIRREQFDAFLRAVRAFLAES